MGENRVIETTAIAVIAWMKDQTRYGNNIVPAINWLVAQVKSGGRYGSTQATILSLKAITSYMQNFASINGKGNFVLRLNGQVAQTISFTAEKKDAINFDLVPFFTKDGFKGFFDIGKTVNINIALENYQANPGETKDFRVNYAFTFNYYDSTPQSVSSVLGFEVA